jgi:hypothetical protein
MKEEVEGKQNMGYGHRPIRKGNRSTRLVIKTVQIESCLLFCMIIDLGSVAKRKKRRCNQVVTMIVSNAHHASRLF